MTDSAQTLDIKQEKSEEDEILELAKKELLRDIKCASIRAEHFGAHSWAKPQNYVPSKRFLRQMLMNASKDNERRERAEQDTRNWRRDKEKERYSVKHSSQSYRSSVDKVKDDKRSMSKHLKQSSSSKHRTSKKEYEKFKSKRKDNR